MSAKLCHKYFNDQIAVAQVLSELLVISLSEDIRNLFHKCLWNPNGVPDTRECSKTKLKFLCIKFTSWKKLFLIVTEWGLSCACNVWRYSHLLPAMCCLPSALCAICHQLSVSESFGSETYCHWRPCELH